MARFIIVVVGLAALAGCTTSNVVTQDFTSAQNSRVLLMPPDIKYYLVTASGITEPQPEWTEQARTAFSAAFEQFSASSDLEIQVSARDAMSDSAIQYDRLHSAVGSTILANHYGVTKLPSKRIGETTEYNFDWSLGSGVADLASETNADYALFVYFRDYEASGGRVGLALFAAVLGAAIYTGHQGGFASLVNLESGDVVWFNNVPIAQGNMRTPEGASRLVKQLFAELAPDSE